MDALPNAWLLLLLFAMKKFGVLEMLKVSTRNCMFTRSVTGKFLKSDKPPTMPHQYGFRSWFCGRRWLFG